MDVSELKIEVNRKNIKNIHLGVYPPEGKIRVAAPQDTTDEKVRLLITSKIPWIKKQQKKFLEQPRQSKREYVTGESHYFLGERYLLNVEHVPSNERLEIKKKHQIDMYVNKTKPIEKRQRMMEDFYRSALKKQLKLLVEKWEPLIGVEVQESYVRKMKTKWGSSNPKDKRIWLNLELGKQPVECLEYVVVHEMVHFLEKKHTAKFFELMNQFLPDWQKYRNELNNSIQGYFSWK